MKVVWTEQAFLRLAEIEDFIARDNPPAAVKLVSSLIEKAEALTKFPQMGRQVPDVPGSDLRELIEGNYRIVYRVRKKIVEIITVFEAHRLLPEEDLGDE
ncbi:type II toxin-antitoxin system RelE/ParE family toxin [Myxococcota bacterium]